MTDVRRLRQRYDISGIPKHSLLGLSDIPLHVRDFYAPDVGGLLVLVDVIPMSGLDCNYKNSYIY